MSDNNDINLLDDDDLEDDIDYDLGNDDEDRLLADDYEVQSSSQLAPASSETTENELAHNFAEADEPAEDDILDLGDGLDDLDSEIQDTLERSINETIVSSNEADAETEAESTDINQSTSASGAENSVAEDVSGDPAPHLESEEEEETKEIEGRDRFKSERTNIISLKKSVSVGNIPDTLDNVIPPEELNFKKKGRGRWNFGARNQRQNMRGPGMNQRFYQQKQQQYHHQQQKKHFQQEMPPYSSFNQHPSSFLPGQQTQKILINPHFRGAVQPHPDARLIWDREPGINNGFPPRMAAEDDYRPPPHGGFDGQFHPGAVRHDGFRPHGQVFPAPVPLSQPPPQYYGDNFREPPPAPGPRHAIDPWQNQGPMQTPPPLVHHQMGPPPPLGDYFREPPNPYPPPQQSFAHFQEPAPPRFPAPPSVVPLPDVHAQGTFRGYTIDDSNVPDYFRQQTQRFQSMKRRAQFQGPAKVLKKNVAPKQQQNMGTPVRSVHQPETSVPQTSPSTNVIPIKLFDPPQKRKKRMPDMSNLHEVKTVDTLPEQPVASTTVESEGEDEETREYRRKIEEQKRMREEVLRAKETRRMMAALEKQRQLKLQQQKSAAAVELQQGNAIATIVNRNPVQPQAGQTASSTAGRGRGILRNAVKKPGGLQQCQLQQQQQMQQPRQGQKITISKQSVQGAPAFQNKATSSVPGRIVRAGGQQGVAVGGPGVAKRVPGQQQQQQQQQQQARQVVLRGTAPPQQRLVVQNQTGRTVVTSEADSSETVLSEVRIARSVAVDNLSAATDEMQLRRLCLRVGPVEKVQMLPQQKRAIITFVKPVSAANFIKLYQRKMVDLSLISVSLVL